MVWFSWICVGLGIVLILVSGVAIVLEKMALGHADVGGYYGESKGALSPAVIAQLKAAGRLRIPRAALGSLLGLDLFLVGLGGLAVVFGDGHWLAWVLAFVLWAAAITQLVAWFRASRG